MHCGQQKHMFYFSPIKFSRTNFIPLTVYYKPVPEICLSSLLFPSKFFWGGGHLIHYDRKLLYILGIKKNHITSGFSGGEDTQITNFVKSGSRGHFIKGNMVKIGKITTFFFFRKFSP